MAPDILSSPEIQAFASGFPVLILHVLVTFGLLGLGATVYAWLTPWKEIRLIREGNAAAAVAFGGVLLGLAIPLADGEISASVLLVAAKLATALILAAALAG